MAVCKIRVMPQYDLSVSSLKEESIYTLYMTICSSLLTISLTVMKASSYNRWKQSELKEYDSVGIKFVLYHSAVILIQPYSFLEHVEIMNWDSNSKEYIPIKLNYILFLSNMPRAIMLAVTVFNVTKFRSPRSSRVCSLYSCQNSVFFTLKCYFKEVPSLMLVCALVPIVIIMAICIKIFQTSELALDHPLKGYQNCFWLAIVTITSVGYGDSSPRTDFGRIIVFLCTFFGAFIVSAIVLAVINVFELNKKQKKSLITLKRVQRKRMLKKKAALYIRTALWTLWSSYRKRKQFKVLTYQQDDQQSVKVLCKAKNQFRDAFRESGGVKDQMYNLREQMDRQLQNIIHSIQSLDENFDLILDYLREKYFFSLPPAEGQSKAQQNPILRD